LSEFQYNLLPVSCGDISFEKKKSIDQVLVTLLLATAALYMGSNLDIAQKYKATLANEWPTQFRPNIQKSIASILPRYSGRLEVGTLFKI
jgi:hypothetical protein